MNLIECHFVVTWSLILLVTYVCGIAIDGQLTVIKNDCYERLAIGEKLSPKQTYKTFDHNTVLKCEMECTQEKETCRSFSFGIGPKGNATCLLSRNPIKETVDLKPIGTISDTDYDLYTKKLDCQVVHEPPHFHASQGPVEKPSEEIHHGQNEHIEHHYGQDKHHAAFGNVPSQSNYYNTISKPNGGPENGYFYEKPYQKPNNQYLPPPPPTQNNHQENNLHHVQTLVSIASGPQSVLHPVHDILVSGDAYGSGKPSLPSKPGGSGYGNHNGNMLPFRPPALNHPYEANRPQIPLSEHYQRPGRPPSDYENLKPDISRPSYEHNGPDYLPNIKPIRLRPNDFDKPYRPLYGPPPDNDRPDPEYGPRPPKIPNNGYGSGGQFTIDRRKYQSSSQFNSFDFETLSYGPDLPKDYPSDYNFYDHYDKLNPDYPNRYGSVIPHPNDYTRPDPHYDYLFVRPNSEPYDDRRPLSRPLRPEYDNQKPLDNRPDRLPSGGPYRPNFDAGNRPRPGYENQRPIPGDITNQKYGMSSRPTPENPNPYDQPNPSTPVNLSTSSSRPPSTELSNHYGGVDYTNKQYGKPGEYSNEKGGGGNRKIITQSIGSHGEQITSIITELQNVVNLAHTTERPVSK